LLEGLEKADEGYHLIKSKIVRGLSIGYKTVRSRMRDEVRELLELKL
jgi:hypothetical protein